MESDTAGEAAVTRCRISRHVTDFVRTADLQQLTLRGIREWLQTHLGLESGTHYSKVGRAICMHINPGPT